MGTVKDRNGMDVTEAEDIQKKQQENTEELYKKKKKKHNTPQKGALDFLIILIAFQL